MAQDNVTKRLYDLNQKYINRDKIKPTRVAHIMGKWLGGGVESFVMNYYRHIDKEKIQFDFICEEGSKEIPVDEIKSMGGKVIMVPSHKNLFKYLKAVTSLLVDGEYKIVHSHLNALSVFPLMSARKAKVPVRIIHAHSTNFRNNPLKIILKPFARMNATHFFCCSEYAGRWLFGNKLYDKGKVVLLKNAIDLERFKYNEPIRAQKRIELGVNGDVLVIGHVGRFDKNKNQTFLIDIFNEIYKVNKKSILVLAGKGEVQGDVRKKVKDLDLTYMVKFLGQEQETYELYQAFDVFVFPSFYEDVPMAVVEAQASGNLCFVNGNVDKSVNILPTTRFLSLKRSPKEWADMILAYSKLFVPRSTARELREAGFDVRQEAQKLEKYYLDLVK